MELFRKIFIEGNLERLPKEEGEYIAHNSFNNIISKWSLRNKNQWLERIDWYLQPVSREEVIEIIKNHISGLSTRDFIAEHIADELIGGVK